MSEKRVVIVIGGRSSYKSSAVAEALKGLENHVVIGAVEEVTLKELNEMFPDKGPMDYFIDEFGEIMAMPDLKPPEIEQEPEHDHAWFRNFEKRGKHGRRSKR